jgi:hypothetical protein
METAVIFPKQAIRDPANNGFSLFSVEWLKRRKPLEWPHSPSRTQIFSFPKEPPVHGFIRNSKKTPTRIAAVQYG